MKSIVIFGACSAIAQATARLWAKSGAEFVLIDRNGDRLHIVLEDLKAHGAKNVHTITTDLTETKSHSALIQEIHQHMNPEVYLFAYGTLSNQKKGEHDFAYAHNELHINFVSVASLLTKIVNARKPPAAKNDLKNRGDAAGVPHRAPASTLKPSGGGAAAAGPRPSHHFLPGSDQKVTLAVISSVAGDRGRQSNYVYGTAKGALTIWLQGLRNRLHHTQPNVHVLTIKPGFVDTPMTANFKKGLLWVKPEAIALGIVRAIDKKKDVVYLPWFWRYIMLVIKAIPEAIFKNLTL